MLRALTLSGTMILALLATAIPPASAHGTLPPSTLATDPDQPGDLGVWHLIVGAAYRDTVSVETAAALVASAAALQGDDWVLEPVATSHILTTWKPIHHVLFRLFSGAAFERVVVDVRPLSSAQSEIRFQGVLASRRDLEHNPARGWAERAYEAAVHVWQGEVRDGIARQGGGNRP